MLKHLHFRLSLLQFLQFFLWGSWFVTAGTYLLGNLQFSGREVGLVYATTAIAATISPFLVGMLADRFFSVEKLLSILHFIGAGMLFGISYIREFELFYPAILIYMFCYLPTFSLTNSLCFHHIKDTKQDFPRIRVWGTIAWILAGLLIGFLEVEGQALPFRIAACGSVIQGFYCLTLPKTPPQVRKGTNVFKSIFSPEIRQLLKDRSLMVMIASIALICIPTSYYYSFVNPFLNEMGVVNAVGKMSVGQVTEILLMLALPWFFRVFRLKTLLFIGLLTWGLRYGLFILGIHYQTEMLFMLGLVVHGVAYIFSILTAQIYLDRRVPAHLRSTAQGFYVLLTFGVGAFVGSYIAGEMVSLNTLADGSHDWTNIWLLPTCFGIAVAFGFWIFFKSKDKA